MEQIGEKVDFLKNQRKTLPHYNHTWLDDTNKNHQSKPKFNDLSDKRMIYTHHPPLLKIQ